MVGARHERLPWVNINKFPQPRRWLWPTCSCAEIEHANVVANVLNLCDPPTANPSTILSPTDSGPLRPWNLPGPQRWPTSPLPPHCHSEWRRGPGRGGANHLPRPASSEPFAGGQVGGQGRRNSEPALGLAVNLVHRCPGGNRPLTAPPPESNFAPSQKPFG